MSLVVFNFVLNAYSRQSGQETVQARTARESKEHANSKKLIPAYQVNVTLVLQQHSLKYGVDKCG
jgi:hypothetical protein